MGIKIGICGIGNFSRHFIELFKAHPDVDAVYLADQRRDHLAEKAKEHGIETTFESLENLCKSDCDGVVVFTQRWLHGPHAVQALKAGKHVFSAVPMAMSLEEIEELVETVESTGLIYMLGETSYYGPQTIYCRERFANGDFGRFVYGSGQYLHDMAHFYFHYYRPHNGEQWKRYASNVPMHYPTHSTARVLGVTFRRMTAVSCFGFVDDHPDGIFDAELSEWNNTFSNETGLFRTSDGGSARINEFRRTGAGSMAGIIMGTLGAYEEQSGRMAVWSSLNFDEGYRTPDGEIDYANAKDHVKHEVEDVSHVLQGDGGVTITEENLGDLPREYIGHKHIGTTWVHPIHRLPKEFIGLPNGHRGSHQFLVVDFIEAIKTNKLPPNHVWQAARYNAPGIVAHESAKREGELLNIPDFGTPPDDAALMDVTFPLQP